MRPKPELGPISNRDLGQRPILICIYRFGNRLYRTSSMAIGMLRPCLIGMGAETVACKENIEGSCPTGAWSIQDHLSSNVESVGIGYGRPTLGVDLAAV